MNSLYELIKKLEGEMTRRNFFSKFKKVYLQNLKGRRLILFLKKVKFTNTLYVTTKPGARGWQGTCALSPAPTHTHDTQHQHHHPNNTTIFYLDHSLEIHVTIYSLPKLTLTVVIGFIS